MKLFDNINVNELASLIQIRNHLTYLLNSTSTSLIPKGDVRKIQNLLFEMDKYFLNKLISSDSAPVSVEEKNISGFIKFGVDEVGTKSNASETDKQPSLNLEAEVKAEVKAEVDSETKVEVKSDRKKYKKNSDK